MKQKTIFRRANQRPRTILAEICGDGDHLIRRERYTTETVGAAAMVFLTIWKKPGKVFPGARWVHFYYTPDEPRSFPALSIDLTRSYPRHDGKGEYYRMTVR